MVVSEMVLSHTAALGTIINGDFDSLASIVYSNGFNNAVTFNRVFRRSTGKSSREYMKEYNKNIEPRSY